MLVIIPQSEVELKLSVGLFNSVHPFQLCSGVTNPDRSPLPLPLPEEAGSPALHAPRSFPRLELRSAVSTVLRKDNPPVCR